MANSPGASSAASVAGWLQVAGCKTLGLCLGHVWKWGGSDDRGEGPPEAGRGTANNRHSNTGYSMGYQKQKTENWRGLQADSELSKTERKIPPFLQLFSFLAWALSTI